MRADIFASVVEPQSFGITLLRMQVVLNPHGDVSSSALRRQRQLDAASSPQLFAPGASL